MRYSKFRFLISLTAVILPIICCLVFSSEATDLAKKSEIRMFLGVVKKIPVQGLKRIVIENPKIADIAEATANEITLEPKSFGKTNLTYLDNLGEHKFVVRVFKTDLEDLELRINNILRDIGLLNVVTKINEDEGKVFLLGHVLNSLEKQNLEKVLSLVQEDIVDLVKIKEEETPIEIDVQITEVNKNDLDKLGVAWRLEPFTSLAEDPFAGPKSMLRWGYMKRTGLEADINLLVQRGKGRILSRPKIVCLSGKTAELVVGGEVPVVTIAQSTTSTGTNVEYKQYGITLRIKPIVKPDNRITLGISIEVSDIDTTRAIVAGSIGTGTGSKDILIPAFITERADTEVFLNSEETVFLAGLIKNKDLTTIKQPPFLGNLPLLGNLFKSRDFSGDQTELVISLTPRIVKIESSGQPNETKKAGVGGIFYPPTPPVNPSVSYSTDTSTHLTSLAFNKYTQEIRNIIANELLKYPLPADLLGWEGRVVVSLFISSDGRLKDAVIKESSGYDEADEIVINVVREKSPYPAFPDALKDRQEVNLDLPIIF